MRLGSIFSRLPLKNTLDFINNQPHPPKQIPHTKRPASHTHSIDKEINQQPVDNHKSQKDPETAPLVAVVHVQRGHVLRAVAVGAVLAVCACVRVEQIPVLGDVCDEVACVVGAGLARGRVEVGCFRGGAVDLHGGEDGGDDAAEPPGDRVDIVHPVFPEDRVVAVGTDDTVEEVAHDEEEREDLLRGLALKRVVKGDGWTYVGDDGERRRKGADPLAPARHEEEE